MRVLSEQPKRLRFTLRQSGRVVATGSRSVRANGDFTITPRARARVRPGRYTLTTTLRPIGGRVGTASERALVR